MDATGDNFQPLATYYATSERNQDRLPKHRALTAEPSLRELLHETDICFMTSAKDDETRKASAHKTIRRMPDAIITPTFGNSASN
jgi:phosphoglycerate dehydrogenase-like enzyme